MSKSIKNINIFGVGRSGTKLVQLYLCIQLLKIYKYCYLNYEPFYYLDRRCKYISVKGIEEHCKLPLIIKKCSNNNEYLEKKIKNKDSFPIVSKYIRGCGRIPYINKSTNTKKSILVIRPVYDVLNSLSYQYWDLLGKNLFHPYDFNRLVNTLSRTDRRKYYKKVKSDAEKNALYWYKINKAALDSVYKEDVLILDFIKILKNPNRELKKINNHINIDLFKIDCKKISGDFINNNKIISNINFYNPTTFEIYGNRLLNIYREIHTNINSNKIILQVIFKIMKMSKINPYYLDKVKLTSDKINAKTYHTIKKSKYRYEEIDIIKEMNNEIYNLIK